MSERLWAEYRTGAYPYKFEVELLVGTLVGGVPSDPRVAEGWIRTKMGVDSDTALQQMVAQVMADRGVTPEEAIKIANEMKNLNGFKRDQETGELYIEGRQVKAMIKEAVGVAVAVKKVNQRGWGETRKNLLSFTAEHMFVWEENILLGVKEPSGVHQRFVHTWKGTGIQYEEYVTDATVKFTVLSDYGFEEKDWAAIFLTAEKQGLGATRSMGYGTFETVKFSPIKNNSKLARQIDGKD